MAGKPVRTIRLRRLVAELTRVRLSAGLTPEQAAKAADLGRAWVYRVETFAVLPRVNNVKAFLIACGITGGPEMDRIVQLARDASRPGWWHEYDLSASLATFVALESEAAGKRAWTQAFIPGLLQTEGYARAVITAGPDDLPPGRADGLVRARLERAKILHRPQPLRLHVIMDEAALTRGAGDPGMMAGQLRHLMGAAQEPHVTVQVVPFGAGAHPGMAGPFTILEYPDDHDVVYAETPVAGGVYAEEPDDISRAHRAFSKLSSLALSPHASIDLIARYAKEL